jgi:hypothetical protein
MHKRKQGKKLDTMKILIGYAQRSGSTLLQHILNEHSQISSYSDANSLLVLPAILSGYKPESNVCVKPLDFLFMLRSPLIYRRFDKHIWIARDPRDSYLSAMEIGFSYFFWLPGKKVGGVDTGQIKRWKLVYEQFFLNRRRWHLVHYEDLVTNPEPVLQKMFEYLELPYEKVFPFPKFNLLSGGDPKLLKTKTIHKKSVKRYRKEMPRRQQRVFKMIIGKEMRKLGYS